MVKAFSTDTLCVPSLTLSGHITHDHFRAHSIANTTAITESNTTSSCGYKIRDGKMVGIKVCKPDSVMLVRNRYHTHRPTVNMEYLAVCQQPKRIDSVAEPGDIFELVGDATYASKLRFRISDSVWEYNCVKNALLNGGLQRTTTSHWNVLWSKHLRIDDLRALHPAQKANHFPGSSILGRKDRLAQLMEKLRARHGADAYEFVPRSFAMPEDYSLFQAVCDERKRLQNEERAKEYRQRNCNRFEFEYSRLAKANSRRSHRDNKAKESAAKYPSLIWMVKPFSGSCGRGIRLVTEPHHVGRNAKVLVQQYLDRPFLIDGRKFDLRLYCVVTSFDPLLIYLFHDGLVRFSTAQYSCSPKALRNKQIHLTNYSIQKKYRDYKKSADGAEKRKKKGRHPLLSESKWSVQQLWRYLSEQKGVDTDAVMERIHAVLIKTVMGAAGSTLPKLQRARTRWDQCFEILGVDVMLDERLKPWLLEVNLLPSLSSSSPLDKRIKSTLMCDVFHCVGIEPLTSRRPLKSRTTPTLLASLSRCQSACCCARSAINSLVAAICGSFSRASSTWPRTRCCTRTRQATTACSGVFWRCPWPRSRRCSRRTSMTTSSICSRRWRAGDGRLLTMRRRHRTRR